MKKGILLIILSFFFIQCSSDTIEEEEETVFPEKDYYGYVELRSQSQLQFFASEKYTKIYGAVYIRGDASSDPITDLSPLKSISHITKYLWIDYNYDLIEINGFENLDTIGEQLMIRENYKLKKINAFPNIKRIDEGIFIDNPELEEINGFNKLTDILSLEIKTGGHFATRIVGFDDLTNIWGDVFLSGLEDIDLLKNLDSKPSSNIRILDFPLLTHLNDLSHITEIEGSLFIENLPNLENISGLAGLTVVKGELSLNNLPKLPNLEGLSNLSTVGDWLSLYKLPTLLNVDGLSNLIFAKDLRLEYLDLITHLNGLSNLRGELDGTNSYLWRLFITNNPALRDFCGIRPLLLESNPSLYIWDNFYNPSSSDITNGNCSI